MSNWKVFSEQNFENTAKEVLKNGNIEIFSHLAKDYQGEYFLNPKKSFFSVERKSNFYLAKGFLMSL